MKHRGSGFKKIKADYRRVVNYRSETEPLFRSTPTSSFFVTLYNLNYNVPVEKVSITREHLSIQNAINGTKATKAMTEKAKILFAQMTFDGIFGCNDIMKILTISITAAGNLHNCGYYSCSVPTPFGQPLTVPRSRPPVSPSQM